MNIESKKGLRIFCCRPIWSDLAPRVGVYELGGKEIGLKWTGERIFGGGMKKGVMAEGGKGGEA